MISYLEYDVASVRSPPPVARLSRKYLCGSILVLKTNYGAGPLKTWEPLDYKQIKQKNKTDPGRVLD